MSRRTTRGTICNALDEYVWKIDENYSYELIQTNTDYKRVTGYTFKMRSQKWLNETYWEHTKVGFKHKRRLLNQ